MADIKIDTSGVQQQTKGLFSSGIYSSSASPPTVEFGSVANTTPRGKTENKVKSIKECRVCGDGTTGTYFGAVVCLPCKTFFIRYGAAGTRRLRCRNNNSCLITITSRTRCKHCRLMKCYSVGMVRKERPEVMHAKEGQELCSVCHDIANGIHFGTYTCEGCKKFFRRGLKENHSYRCVKDGSCVVNPRSRNTCRYCRFRKCMAVGMTHKVRVGRPRKAQREFLLSTIQKMSRHNSSSGESDQGSSLSSGVRSDSDATMSPSGGQRAEVFPSCLSRSESCSSLSSCETDSTMRQEPETVILPSTILPEPNFGNPREVYSSAQSPGLTSATLPMTELEQMVSDRPVGYFSSPTNVALQSDNVEEERLNVQGTPRVSCSSVICSTDMETNAAHSRQKVYVGDFTYLLSDSLSRRYLHTVLPYWTHPLLPSGDCVCSPEERQILQQLSAAHSEAVDALQGPFPTPTILKEALASGELTDNVGDFLRHRLVRILNSFISFLKSQPVLLDLHEEDVLTVIRMTVNTWALVGAACRYYNPVTRLLPHVHDIMLHADNQHSPLNGRNLHIAHKLHKLHLDDTEAALLIMSCILATDSFDMKEPEIIEKKRWGILRLFRAHTTAKYGWPNWRMEELFACVPEMRLVAIWFNDLSYTTWFPQRSTKDLPSGSQSCPS